MGVRAFVDIGPQSRNQITNFFASMALKNPHADIQMSLDRNGLVFKCGKWKLICETDTDAPVVDRVTSPRY